MNTAKVTGVFLVLSFLISNNSLHTAFSVDEPNSVSGKVKEIVADKTRELYVDRIISSEIPDTEDQKISVNLVCKNLLTGPNACVDVFFFSIVDTSGKEHEANLAQSRIMAARIPRNDTVQGTLVFVMPKAENATQLTYTEPKSSKFLIDLSSTKAPADKAPNSEWRLVTNKRLTLSDSRIELTIVDETRVKDRYVLDISIRNIGNGIVDYNALYAYLKTGSGLSFSANPHADVEGKIGSGTLSPGQQKTGKIAFDSGNESGPFMFIYDDIAGSYFATGKFVPQTSSRVKGVIMGDEGLVRIEKHNSYFDPVTKTYKVIGEVSNGSDKFVGDIRISAVLKDKSGNVISSLNHTLRNFLSSSSINLAPNVKVPFFVDFIIPSTSVGNIGSYELLLRYSPSEGKKAALLVSSAELVQASKPTPLSKDILWQVKGELENIGDVRSKHTQVMVSLYFKNSIVGSGGFSTLDLQPGELNPRQKISFRIEIPLPKSFKPESFYLYAESDQYVIAEPKTYAGIEEELELEPAPKVEVQDQNSTSAGNYTSVKIMSKQREDLMQIIVKNLPNSTKSIYAIQIFVDAVNLDTLKGKLRWNGSRIADGELLLNGTSNPIRPGQRGEFLFSVDDEINLLTWKALDPKGTVLSEGEVRPFQIRR